MGDSEEAQTVFKCLAACETLVLQNWVKERKHCSKWCYMSREDGMQTRRIYFSKNAKNPTTTTTTGRAGGPMKRHAHR